MPVKSARNLVILSDGTDDLRQGSGVSGNLVVYGQDVLTESDPYLEGTAQSNFENLSGVAKSSQPPTIGHAPITFSNSLGSQAVHDGRPDWGSFNLADRASWSGLRGTWVEKETMPLMGIGADVSQTVEGIKWVNEGGLFDTVNLNYRDSELASYFGWSPASRSAHVDYPLIAQSVPRSSFLLNESGSIYPFLHQTPFTAPYENSSDYFNDQVSTGSLGVRSNSPSVSHAGLGLDLLDFDPSTRLSPDLLPHLNLTVSGKLFPADRGVLALVRFPSDADATSVSFEGVPATTSLEVLQRCVGAIKLGHGVGQYDGLAGGDLFNDSDAETFPSKKAGQYDLAELHLGDYVEGSTRTGAIPELSGGDPTLGRVRLLSDPLAFNSADNTTPLGIPVLFSPYTTFLQDPLDAQSQVQLLNSDALINLNNFFSYRLPVLADYRPEGLITPVGERDRFFVKKEPNRDWKKPDYNRRFETAGGYVTFGLADNYSYQVARYKHSVRLLFETDYRATVIDDSEPEYNLGSFALLHFKTESAFERLVRDGLAPSDEELYSVNLVSYSDMNQNVGVSLGIDGSDGLEDSEESFAPSSSLSVFRPNVNIEMKTQGYPDNITISQASQTRTLYPSLPDTKIERTNTYFSWVSGVIYVHPTSPFSYEGHPTGLGLAGESYYADDTHRYSRLYTEVQIDQKVAQGSDVFSQWDKESTQTPYRSPRPSAQILVSGLTAQDNLVANNADWFGDKDLSQFDLEAKRQSVWVTISGLGGTLSGDIVVMPTGDAVKPIDSLDNLHSKSGLCTFSTSAQRASVMVNKPHRQLRNLGVELVVDDVEVNPYKTLYHSARKLSLLELMGSRLSPSGKTATNADITGLSDIRTDWAGVGAEMYASQDNFLYGYIYLDWNNINANGSQDYSPKSAGQSFSIYRYDEEGYKVYQQLDLLPIGGQEFRGYALELCSGWNRVDENDVEVATSNEFKYPANRPVYRMVENSEARTSLKTHADARFVMVKDVIYYIECYPSVPWKTGDVPAPADFDSTTVNEGIIDKGGSGYSDIQMVISENEVEDVWSGYAGTSGLYTNLSGGGIRDDQCEWLGENLDPTQAPYNVDPSADTGNTSHVRSIMYARHLGLTDIPIFDLYYNSGSRHPHPQPSTDKDGFINYGVVFLEVAPTGRMQLPEYGNFTQDVRGFITVSGLGNAYDNLHAVDPDSKRVALSSLFTLRKDTQERFLDESYRIESSLSTLVNGSLSQTPRYGNTINTVWVVDGFSATPTSDNSLIENLQGPGLPNPNAGVNDGYIAFPVRDENTLPTEIFLKETNGVDSSNYFAHGGAGYLRNSHHVKRLNTITWKEAQVVGFPDMTRSLLSGSQYGTPPRGVLVYPYIDFNGETQGSLGHGANNTLISSNKGYFFPNAGQGTNDPREGEEWIDDNVTASNPKLRHAQPDYSAFASKDVGYLRAFDLNFGKASYLTPQQPYWNEDWYEGDNLTARGDRDAQNIGLIESGEWERVRRDSEGNLTYTPIKLRLVGVDWDMISYLDPEQPLQPRDGFVHLVNNKPYLMRKRVMRVFVKVPGLTTWLDVGVMDNQFGESYVHSTGEMSEHGATNDKTSLVSDGAGCCVSYKETYLVEEGLVALDLELNVGLVPAFNSYGNLQLLLNQDGNLSVDTYLGIEKEIRVDNCPVDKLALSHHAYNLVKDRNFSFDNDKLNKEAPLLVKVVLSDPDSPKYEVDPADPSILMDINGSGSYAVADIGSSVIDIWAGANKSYRGHSYPPDDRAPSWSRRGLMGIEVLRPDGSNFDRDEVVDRPDFTKIDLHQNPTLYYARRSNLNDYEGYTYPIDQSANGNVRESNRVEYTFDDALVPSFLRKLPTKGEG